MAMKATYVCIKGEELDIFKDPVTDDGMKKSNVGLLCVTKEDGRYTVQEKVSWETEAQSELETVFVDGRFTKIQTLAEIRARLASYRK